MRSAAYRSASVLARQEVHGALADVTDPARTLWLAWHVAEAAPGPDEDVAAELVRSAGRARAAGTGRGGGIPGAAALLTPDPVRRAQRLLAAARATCDAGSLNAALGLLVAVEAGPLDQQQGAEVDRLRGQIAFDQRRGIESARLLFGGARQLEPVGPDLGRAAHLVALVAAVWASDMASPTCGRRPPRRVPRPRAGSGPRDRPSARRGCAAPDGWVRRRRPALNQRWRWFSRWTSVRRGRPLALARRRQIGQIIAMELWDFEAWQTLAARQVRFARDTGALMHLAFALNYMARTHILAGELTAAARLIEEDHLIAEATGNSPIADTAMMLAAWRGQESEASELIEAISREATAHGAGRLVSLAAYANSVLYNGLGRHDDACDAARQAFEREPMGYGSHIVPELAEAAARAGDIALAGAALQWLSERTRVTPGEWVLGIEARVRALLSEDEAAESHYRDSIGHLSRTSVRAQLARTHLLYGEWLRRQGRRADAREQLRTAHGMLEAMGMEAFAERARRELLATGETARKRAVPATVELTAQEAQVARLARDGLSNPEIGARLFISARTVQYHLSKVFTKLDITSRGQLHRALRIDPGTSGTLAVPGPGHRRTSPAAGLARPAGAPGPGQGAPRGALYGS